MRRTCVSVWGGISQKWRKFKFKFVFEIKLFYWDKWLSINDVTKRIYNTLNKNLNEVKEAKECKNIVSVFYERSSFNENRLKWSHIDEHTKQLRAITSTLTTGAVNIKKCKLLNVISLGPCISDHMNWMITITCLK